jgi:hypothetical protein
VQLLTHLEQDTGFTTDNLEIDENGRAGLELDLLSSKAPYIVKNPWLCDTITEILKSRDIIIDHAFIPFRDLEAAARSRAYVQEASGKHSLDVPGGLWHTREPSSQRAILSEQFYKLITALGEAGVPMTFLSYPRLANDPTYTYHKMQILLRSIPYAKFKGIFERVRRPELIHQFTVRDH